MKKGAPGSKRQSSTLFAWRWKTRNRPEEIKAVRNHLGEVARLKLPAGSCGESARVGVRPKKGEGVILISNRVDDGKVSLMERLAQGDPIMAGRSGTRMGNRYS